MTFANRASKWIGTFRSDFDQGKSWDPERTGILRSEVEYEHPLPRHAPGAVKGDYYFRCHCWFGQILTKLSRGIGNSFSKWYCTAGCAPKLVCARNFPSLRSRRWSGTVASDGRINSLPKMSVDFLPFPFESTSLETSPAASLGDNEPRNIYNRPDYLPPKGNREEKGP